MVVQGVHASGLWMATRIGKGWARYCGNVRFCTEPSLGSEVFPSEDQYGETGYALETQSFPGVGDLENGWSTSYKRLGSCPDLAQGPDKGVGTACSS